MEKLMIYPYTTEADVFVRNSDLMEGYEISALVSLRGSGYQNVSHSINGNSILVHEDFEKALEECTAILPVFYDPNREIIESEYDLLINMLRKQMKQQLISILIMTTKTI